jgi:tight adherence protein D
MSEQLLVKSSNYPRLIELYKDKLKKYENAETRQKLAQAYIDNNDNDSALFTLAPLVSRKKIDSEVFYLQGLAQYNLGKTNLAQDSLDIALARAPNNAKLLNMIGIVYANKGDLEQARLSFNKARELMYDDVTIKNNLALLDLIEGKYQDAASKLLPVYINNRGKIDENVKANLAIIMAKLGSFDYIRTLYSDKYNTEQLLEIYNDLKASELINNKELIFDKNSKKNISNKSGSVSKAEDGNLSTEIISVGIETQSVPYIDNYFDDVVGNRKSQASKILSNVGNKNLNEKTPVKMLLVNDNNEASSNE